MRKTLLSLIQEVTPYWAEVLTDYLIKNGVTIPVRCKDCKHWKKTGSGCGWCQAWEGGRFHDNYCNYGEKKENG